MPFDPAHPLASVWLLACVVVFTAAIGIPLTVAPLRWGRALGWSIPGGDTDLTVYFGRCLGAVVLVLAFLLAGAAADPAANRWAFHILMLAGGAMTAVHAWGWLRRIQPWFENLETFLYGAVVVSTWMVARTL